jgi:thioredoxin reductase
VKCARPLAAPAREVLAMYDVIVVGGGAAGLSAALVLGRCRRRVLVCDKGSPRNCRARAMHGFISRDGTPPLEFLRIGQEELKQYPTVEWRSCEVTAVERGDRRFKAATSNGETIEARILLLATGMVDELPEIPGLDQFWGTSIHVCPYCDGWERRDQALAVLGRGDDGADLAVEMRHWTNDVTLCTNGEPLPEEKMKCLARLGIRLREEKVARFEGQGEDVRRIVFDDGSDLPCAAVFLSVPQRQRSELALALGCKVTDTGQLECSTCQATTVEGVFAIGNAAHGLQLVIMAAADGTQAAFAINEALIEADVRTGENGMSAGAANHEQRP